MYRKMLVALEHTAYDAAIVGHVRGLAKCCGSSVVFIHVADGWAARNQRALDLKESEEMKQDRLYLEKLCATFEADGYEADALLANGDPAAEIAAAAEREGCDLIAMSTHGHRFLADVVRGSVANEVRHRTKVPVLLVRGSGDGPLPA
jgi:nucleotide-binding universal stress UspA family protein